MNNKLDGLDPEFREKVKLLINNLEKATELKWCVVQGVRTIAYQNSLYNQPIDGIDNDNDKKIDEPDEKVTGARGGQSPHNYKLAVDLAPMKGTQVWWTAPEKYWVALCEMAEGMGLASGYRFNIKGLGKDRPHVEDPRWREQYALWKAGKIKVA